MATLPTVTAGSLFRRPKAERSDGWGKRLRRRLVAAGPAAAAFGIHLGSRVDLFSGTDCLALLETPDSAPASHPARVAELFGRELGGPPAELLEEFDPRPFESGLVTQWHRGRTADGASVLVEVVHPELLRDLDGDALRRLVDRLISSDELPASAAEVVPDFESRLDLRETCLALEELADEVEASGWIDVPRPHQRLCSHRVRVLADLDGRRVEELAAGDDPAGLEARARRLSRSWLALALGGSLFPAEPFGRNMSYLPNGRVAFVGGSTHRLPRALQPELRDYLSAVAAKKPDRAALAFLDLLPEATGNRRLRDRLRHTDPFRDRGWDVGGDRFARQVLAHWRTAGQLGHRLPTELMPFYRGLFLLNREIDRLAATATALRDGLREARLLLLFGELREEAESGRWAGSLERQVGFVAALPQKLDRILTLAAEDDRREESTSRPVGESRAPRRTGWGLVSACLLALTAIALLARHLLEAGTPAAWVEGTGALTVLLLGALLLRAAASGADS